MKKLLAAWVLVLCIFSLLGCTDDADDLVIVAENQQNVPAGEYTLSYTVTDFEKYRESYDLVLTVNVYDEDNASVEVKNNRIVTLETGKKYTVIVRLKGNVNGKEISKFKQFTVETTMANVTAYFYLKDGNYISPYVSQEVAYGGSILIGSIPEIPFYYAQQNEVEGQVRSIVSKKWVVYDENGDYHDLTQDDLTGITHDIAVYSFYEYDVTVLENTVTFVTNGGTEIPSVTGTVQDVLRKPTAPTREGHVFLGWCDDEELTQYHNWQIQTNLSADITLYAKWSKDNSAQATPSSYFNFTEQSDDFGNTCYKLSVKDKGRLSGDIVLPSCYNGLPVRELAIGAFSYTDILSVYVPNTYTMGTSGAFLSCQKLTRVEFEGDNLTKTLNTNTFLDCPVLTTVILPDHLQIIDAGCFSGCLQLEGIILPETLSYINEKAFFSCASLTSVVIPDSVLYVYGQAFDSCYSLTDVVFTQNSSVKEIDSSAFDRTAIQKMTLPSSQQSQIVLNNPTIEIEFFDPPVQASEG